MICAGFTESHEYACPMKSGAPLLANGELVAFYTPMNSINTYGCNQKGKPEVFTR